MITQLHQRHADLVAQRRPGSGPVDVHFTESLAATMLAAFTEPGDRVLDPFAGYGTTLAVAARKGRRAVGVELLPERVAAIRDRVGAEVEVVNGDARQVAQLVRGPFDLCLTSPPYMPATGGPNALSAFRVTDGDYSSYLAELADVFGQIAGLLRPGGHLAVGVADFTVGDTVSELSKDLRGVVSEWLTPAGTLVLRWDRPPPPVVRDYVLVFRKD